MHLLQAVQKHRPVALPADSRMNFDDQVGADTDEVLVKRCVMNFTQAEPIRYDRKPVRM